MSSLLICTWNNHQGSKLPLNNYWKGTTFGKCTVQEWLPSLPPNTHTPLCFYYGVTWNKAMKLGDIREWKVLLWPLNHFFFFFFLNPACTGYSTDHSFCSLYSPLGEFLCGLRCRWFASCQHHPPCSTQVASAQPFHKLQLLLKKKYQQQERGPWERPMQ